MRKAKKNIESKPHSARAGMLGLVGIFIALATLAPFLLPTSASASVELGEPNLSVLSSGLVGYWSMDGSTINWNTNTIADLSGKGDTGTLVNLSTTTSPVFGKVGQALKFSSATAQDISLGTAPSSLVFAYNQPFTFSLWANPSATVGSGVFDRMFSITASSGNFEYFIMANNNAFSLNLGKNGTGDNSVASATFTVGKWYHIVGVYDGTNLSLYINGTKVGSTAYTFGALSSPNGVLSIGGGGSTSNTFNGTIDDVRVYGRALSAQEVALMYAAGSFTLGNTPSTNSSFSIAQGGINSGLVGYWPFDGNTTNWTTGMTADMSGNGNNGQMTSMSTSTSPVPGKIGQALNFNGTTSQFVEASGQVSLGTVNQPYTVSAWVMPASTSESGDILHLSSASNGGSWCLPPLTIGSGKPATISWNAGEVAASSTNALSANQWYQLVATWNSTSGLSLYVNGILQATTAQNAYTASGLTDYLTVGSSNTAGGGCAGSLGSFAGRIDDVRVYNRALSSQEINDLYGVGKVTIDHSNTTSGTGINAGLVGYWTFDGPTINWATGVVQDASGNGNSGQMIAMSTTSSPVIGKIGQALNFNGTSQYINAGTNLTSNFQNHSFSVSLWVNFSNANTADQGLLSIGTPVNDELLHIVRRTNVLYVGFFGDDMTGVTTLVPNKWWNIIVTWNATTHQRVAYINGRVDVSLASSGSLNVPNSSTLYLACYNSGTCADLAGTLDDVHIYNRALSPQEAAQLYATGK